MRTFYFYSLETGMFLSRAVQTSKEKVVAMNTPQGYAAIEGVRDWRSQRVDLETMEIVDYQPPQPSDDHQWNEAASQWEIKPEVDQAHREQLRALTNLQEIDIKKIRPLSELLRSSSTKEEKDAAQQRLDDLEAEAAALRAKLNGATESEIRGRRR